MIFLACALTAAAVAYTIWLFIRDHRDRKGFVSRRRRRGADKDLI